MKKQLLSLQSRRMLTVLRDWGDFELSEGKRALVGFLFQFYISMKTN